MALRRLSIFAVLCTLSAFSFGIQSPETTSVGQSVADAIRSTTGADIALVPAGLVLAGSSSELSARMQYPTDSVAVLKLTGRQIRQGLERGVSIYPTLNPAFLYGSGITYSFDPRAKADARLRSVRVGSAELVDGNEYTVAMPGNIAKGGLGFFTIWDKKAIIPGRPVVTLETVLDGKKANQPDPRWSIVGS